MSLFLARFINRFATPLTTGLFLVSGVSGVALFFRWNTPVFHAMHEWLSMVLLLPFALHVWKNWSALVVYFQRGRLVLPVLAALLFAIPFAWPALTGRNAGGSPGARSVRLLTQTPLSALAPVLRTTPEAIQTRLAQQGLSAAPLDSTLDQIATAANVPPASLLLPLLPQR